MLTRKCIIGLAAILSLSSLTSALTASTLPNAVTLSDGTAMSLDMALTPVAGEHVLVLGGTLGLDWAAMPQKQHVNWILDGPNKGALDVTGDLYLTGVSWDGGVWADFQTPVLWNSLPYAGYYGLFPYQKYECCFYHDCPVLDGWSNQYSYETNLCVGFCPGYAVDVYDNFNSGDVVGMFPGGFFDNGAVRLLDGHGGVASIQLLVLEQIRNNFPVEGEHTHILIVLVYVAPGQFQDLVTGLPVDGFPGDLVKIRVNTAGFISYPVAKVVQHVSADIAGTSPGAVDAGDLASLATALGNCASFCTGTGCQPDGTPNYCTWRADINVDGSIDAGDIAMFVQEFVLADCATSKTAASPRELEQMLSWFGMETTGRTVRQWGMDTPETRIVDESQMRRAIADPYGYRTRGAAIQSRSWSRVKGLYR
jgi:hypothetical protein